MYEHHTESELNYYPCRYGRSKLLFRGPKRKLETPYCAMIGGSETYGKFLEKPFPMLVEDQLGTQVVNLGCVNAGVDAFTSDGEIQCICSGAEVTVVQVLGAQNMSNRFYAVHPRRNDRFLRASSLMKSLFREVDFTQFNFTRHMLSSLHAQAPEKFGMVVDELQEAWCARMQSLAGAVGGRSILLWLSDHVPDTETPEVLPTGPDPMFITAQMLERVKPLFTNYVEVVASAEALKTGVEGMVFAPMQEPAAAEMHGPAVHAEVADKLSPMIAQML